MNKDELLKSKHFCIQPFVHSCIWTDSRVIPCCINQHYVLGNAKTESIKDIYSNSNAKLVEFRKEILNGPELPPSCHRCGDMEEKYADNSYRYYSNKHYGHLIHQIDINDDGTVKENKVFTWDVRYSNLCNLKCRTCDSINSSKIAEEERKTKNKNIIVLKEAFEEPKEFFDFFESNIEYIEEIYFCGGEPLLLEEHYKILDILLAHGKTNTRLRYSTNATKIQFKNKNVVDDYWSKFSKINLGLSLDAGWEQLNLIRHGANWDTVYKNLKYIVSKCPHVFMQFSPTVSILNAFHIKRLHIFLVEENIMKVSDVYYNILTYPDYYSIISLTPELKEQVRAHWKEYKEDLQKLNCNSYMEEEVDKVIKYLDIEDSSHRLESFVNETKNMDGIRGENTLELLPEYKDLFK